MNTRAQCIVRPQLRPGAPKKFRATNAVLLAGALWLGGLTTSPAVGLVQQLLNVASTQIYGTNGVNILADPVGVTTLLGTPVTLSVGASGPDLQYRWKLNGYPLPGATNATLRLNVLTADNCGTYQALVYNSYDTIPSAPASVQLLVPTLPFADSFSNRLVITGTVGLGSGTCQGATREAADPVPAKGWLFRTLWVTWVAPLSGPVEINTVGSGYDSWLGVYTGTVQSNLVAVITDDDGGGYGTSSVEFNATAGTAYQILLGARDYQAAPFLFAWNQAPLVSALPTITSRPTNVTTTLGSAATLKVQFQSTVPTTVQWYRNGLPLAGATNSTLSWSQLGLGDLGSYQAILSSSQWVYPLAPVEIQFNTEGLTTVVARKKLADAAVSGLIGQ